MRKKTKFLVLRTSVILAFALLAGKLWYVQVVMGSYYKQQGDTSKIRLEPVQALRGIIYDRNGHQLVWNAPSWNVMIVPNAIPNNGAASIFSRLSQLLGGQPSGHQIAQIVAQNSWRGYAPILVKASVSPDTAMVVKQLHVELPGVSAEPSSVRHYLEDPNYAIAHVLGYTNQISPQQYASDIRDFPQLHFFASDQTGRDGVEAQLDSYLHGVNGKDQVEVDAGERPVRVLRRGTSVPGDSVYLTLDWNLQRQVSNDLQAALAKYNLRRGVVIVENVNTGEILSMVSLPSFNGNWFPGGISAKHYAALLRDPAHPLDNLATAGLFPPGSTYKLITAAAALQSRTVDANTTVDDTGSIKLCSVYDPSSCRVFNGWKPGGLGNVNIIGALAQSSDIYFYTVAGGNPNVSPSPRYVGATRLARYARLFGLGSPTGVDIPGEAAGFVPTPQWFDNLPVGPLKNPGDAWHIGQTYNMAIGQGFDLATPLQMVNATAAIANGGTLYRPRIVERVVGRVVPRQGLLKQAATIEPFVPSIIRRNFIDPGNLSLIQQGMHLGVSSGTWYGTSYYVHDPRIDAAGKTGTAEAGFNPPHAWWVGYAPYNHPQVAVVVLVPNANAEGAYYAAPIAHKIFEDYFHLKSLKPNWLDDVAQTIVGSGGAQ